MTILSLLLRATFFYRLLQNIRNAAMSGHQGKLNSPRDLIHISTKNDIVEDTPGGKDLLDIFRLRKLPIRIPGSR